jgi:hypothetical protein
MRPPFALPTVDALRSVGFDPDRDALNVYYSPWGGWHISIGDKRLNADTVLQLTTPIDWAAEAALLRGDTKPPRDWVVVADSKCSGITYEIVCAITTVGDKRSATVKVSQSREVHWTTSRWDSGGWATIREGRDPDRSILRAMAAAERLLFASFTP